MRKHIRKYIAFFVVCVMLFGLSACAHTENSASKATAVKATVIEIEKYGHAVLDITTADFCAKGYSLGDVVFVRFGSFESEMPFFDGYYTNPGDVMLRGLAPEKNIAEKLSADKRELDQHEKEINALKDGQRALCTGVMALLDHQLHNGNSGQMENAKTEIEKYLKNLI